MDIYNKEPITLPKTGLEAQWYHHPSARRPGWSYSPQGQKTSHVGKANREASSGEGEAGESDRGVLVLLLGFMGASSRNMQRHVTAYEFALGALQLRSSSAAVGTQYLCVIPPVTYVLRQGMHTEQDGLDSGPYAALAQDIIGATTAQTEAGAETEMDIVIHVCSQNGAFAFRAIMHLCSTTQAWRWRQRHVGTVFDSAPVRLTVTAVDQAVSQAVGSVAGSLLRALLRVLVGGGEKYAARLNSQQDQYESWFSTFMATAAGITTAAAAATGNGDAAASVSPEGVFFLYSSADSISSADHLRRVVASLQHLQTITRPGGGRLLVQSHDFGGSAHVAHVSTYPQEYCRQLAGFLCACLDASWNRGSGEHDTPAVTLNQLKLPLPGSRSRL